MGTVHERTIATARVSRVKLMQFGRVDAINQNKCKRAFWQRGCVFDVLEKCCHLHNGIFIPDDALARSYYVRSASQFQSRFGVIEFFSRNYLQSCASTTQFFAAM